MTISEAFDVQKLEKEIRKLRKVLRMQKRQIEILANSNSAIRAERAAQHVQHQAALKTQAEKLQKERLEVVNRLASNLGQSLSEVAGAQRATAMAIASMLDKCGVF